MSALFFSGQLYLHSSFKGWMMQPASTVKAILRRDDATALRESVYITVVWISLSSSIHLAVEILRIGIMQTITTRNALRSRNVKLVQYP